MAKINSDVSHKLITKRLSNLGLRYLVFRFPKFKNVIMHSNGTIIAYYSKNVYVIVKDVNIFWQSGMDKHMQDKGIKATVVNEPLDIKARYVYAKTIVGAITKAVNQYKENIK